MNEKEMYIAYIEKLEQQAEKFSGSNDKYCTFIRLFPESLTLKVTMTDDSGLGHPMTREQCVALLKRAAEQMENLK